MTEINGRYVKVDLTVDECKAIHELADMANVMMSQLAGSISRNTRDILHARINSVRYKMGIAIELIEPGAVSSPNVLQLVKQ